MPVIAVFLLVTIPSVTLTAPSPHRRDPFRHRRRIASPSPNPDSPKTLARPASPPSTTSQSAPALIPPRTPSPTVPPRTLLSTSERPASHDLSTIWPRTPRYRAMHTAYHNIQYIHRLSLALHSLSLPHIRTVRECTYTGTANCYTHLCMPTALSTEPTPSAHPTVMRAPTYESIQPRHSTPTYPPN